MKKVFPVKLLNPPVLPILHLNGSASKTKKVSKNALSLLKMRNSCLKIQTHFVQEQNQAIHSLKLAFRQYILQYEFFIFTKNHFQAVEADIEL